jgi:hypothetical protein
MGRKKKQDIKVNDNASLEGVMQEVYNDACLQIIETQNCINELTVGNKPENIGEVAIVVKEKGGMLKLKDSAIRIKLEVAKLQSDIIKNRGDVVSSLDERSSGTASIKDFASIREMLKNNKEQK